MSSRDNGTPRVCRLEEEAWFIAAYPGGIPGYGRADEPLPFCTGTNLLERTDCLIESSGKPQFLDCITSVRRGARRPVVL